MQLSKKIMTVFLFSLLLLTGCGTGDQENPAPGGTETGNTQAVTIEVIGYQSSQLGGLLSSLTVESLDVNTARIVLDRIRFRPFSVCQEDSDGVDDIQFDGPFVVDLLQPETLSGLENIEIPTGQYCRIELTFKDLDPEALPTGISPDDPIVDRSILIEGTRSDGTAFRMTTEIDEEFKLENETTGFQIEASSLTSILFIAFDLDQWFTGVNLSASSIEVSTDANGNPIILINDDSNESVQEVIEVNLKFSADLFEDSDDDEDLDPDEQEDSLAAGETVP